MVSGWTCTKHLCELYPGSLRAFSIHSQMRTRRKQRKSRPLRKPQGSTGNRSPSEVGVMFLEKLTAWTLVALYYCVGCGVILLGLRGAL
jgi:hypothetical protein